MFIVLYNYISNFDIPTKLISEIVKTCYLDAHISICFAKVTIIIGN